MGETKTIDTSRIRFTSTAFPTDEDMRLWDSLSAEEHRAAVSRDLDEAEASGIAVSETVEQIIKRVRGEAKSGG